MISVLIRVLFAVTLAFGLSNLTLAPAAAANEPTQPVFISEFHYDNDGTDAGEAIEVFGPAGTSLAGWSLVLYNGATGVAYSTTTLSGSIPDLSGGYGVVVANYAANGIQNGSPDGIALVNASSVVVHAFSYEGTFTAADGPAIGLVLSDIGVSEPSTTALGSSLKLSGAGACLGQLTWQGASAETFAAVSPIDPSGGCEGGADEAPAVESATPADGATGVSESTNLTVTFTEAVSASGAFGVSCDVSGAHASDATGGPTQFTIDPTTDFTLGETCTLTVTAANVADSDTNDPPDVMASDFSSSFTVTAGVVVTPISAIQGSGSAITGAGPFTIDGIVTADYQTQGTGQLRGFFVQEQDADVDADPATSEALFVFCLSCPTPVAVGDHVLATGTASEFFGMSQLTASTAGSVSVQSTGNPLPTASSLSLPVPGVVATDVAGATAQINAYFEKTEGMLVTFPDELSVSEYFELARYGQLELTQGGRLHTFTATNEPSAGGLTAHQIEIAKRTIILDDTDNRQNRPSDAPNTAYYHPVPGLSAANYVRGGDTISDLTGVLHWSFAGQSGTDAWRIRPVPEAFDYAFTVANPRPAAPEVGGSLKVASFNVLNYFLTIDTTASTSVGTCGPSGTLDCRGADSANELAQMRAKLTQALLGLDADVVGLMEMENTPGVDPAAAIVEDLNAAVGAGTYARIDTGAIGTDAIRVGLIYKTASVTPAGAFAILDSAVDPNFDDTRNRPVLAQTFTESATGGRVTVAVNHLKSKGSGCGVGDDDTTTGQGNCNLTRTRAATALASWLDSDPTGSGDADALIIGDLNSYAKEDPIKALTDSGYTDLVAQFGGLGAYGYVFDGQLGYLDHALANNSLTPQVTGVSEWHINADEVPLLDYNDDVRDIGEAAFDEESDTFALYAPNEFRTSDHDPVLIGLDLTNSPPAVGAIEVTPSVVSVDATVEASATFTSPDENAHTASWAWGDGSTSAGVVTESGGSGNVTGSHEYAAAGFYTVLLTITDEYGNSDTMDFEQVVVFDADAGFVTGGGWINSPAGAYKPNPGAAGKGNFSLSSEYVGGASTPTGTLSFSFTSANFNFASTGQDWLVVVGNTAIVSGTGTVNGVAGYAYELEVIDASNDRFSLKVWSVATGTVIYDSGAPLRISKGSIKIHT